jgi:hypothetical protein
MSLNPEIKIVRQRMTLLELAGHTVEPPDFPTGF